jgi:hypothetical protein
VEVTRTRVVAAAVISGEIAEVEIKSRARNVAPQLAVSPLTADLFWDRSTAIDI